MIISLLDVNEIVTYQVNIDFDPNSAVVREGMTTILEYVIQEAKNVLIVPT